ncbi:DUF1294 domain-containing protein [Paenibacillus sp. GCM10027626]|uniref:DUF1294 domain-containing protein n=1 Tax=Paenibacillus sp. GCM10027626 TaxID=3273411 RepID=UPI00362CE7E3
MNANMEWSTEMTAIVLAVYLFLMNIAAFAMMHKDKTFAQRKRHRRIPERRLLLLAFAGGSLGAYLAMRIYHHKTKHPRFAVGIPVMLLAHIAIILVLWYSYGGSASGR